ncbi:MAG: hypothetical protein Kow00124_20550 [Anaerolineae bacterium]
MSQEGPQPIGQVTHYFDRIGVAAIQLWDTLQVGEWVWFWSDHTNFVQQVESMQIDRQPVEVAYAEQSVGVKVIAPVRVGDWVYPYTPES